jgi:hypothetical protein
MAGKKRPRSTTTMVQFTKEAHAKCPFCGRENTAVYMIYCGHVYHRWDNKRKRHVWAWKPKPGEARTAPRLSR